MRHDDPVIREGMFAAYGGQSAFDCPYGAETQPAKRKKWLSGFTLGLQRRRVDRRDGRHPDVAPRRRAGKTIGVRN